MSGEAEREREEQESITVICLISLSGSWPLTVVTTGPAPAPPPLGRRDDLAEALLLGVTKKRRVARERGRGEERESGSGGDDGQGALRLPMTLLWTGAQECNGAQEKEETNRNHRTSEQILGSSAVASTRSSSAYPPQSPRLPSS